MALERVHLALVRVLDATSVAIEHWIRDKKQTSLKLVDRAQASTKQLSANCALEKSLGDYNILLLRYFSSFDIMLLHLKLNNNYASRDLNQNNNLLSY